MVDVGILGKTFEKINVRICYGYINFCRYGGKFWFLDNFEDGFKICKKCLEYQSGSYDKHKDKVHETQRIKYKKMRNTEKKTNIKLW